MKKISILSLHLGYGGIEKSVVSLANMLCDNYKVEIACCYKLYNEPAFSLDKRVKVKYLLKDLKPNRDEFKTALKKKNIINILKEGFKSIKILHERKSKMIEYIQNTKADVIVSTRDIFNEWLGEHGKKNTLKIGWEHNHYHNDFKYARGVVRSVYNLDYFVLVSNSLKDYYEKKLTKSKCKCLYIPNTIDKIPPRKSTLEEKRLICVGRLSEEKGHMDLLKIFALLIKDFPEWQLDIIGDGNEREKLEEFIKKHSISEKVILHGFRDKDYINKMLQKSSIYIMTSYTESFGIVLIEAMSHGVPCVAFDSAEGAKELIDSGMNGYLIKHRSFSAMIKKLSDLMEQRDTRLKIGEAARKKAKQYTVEIVKEDWINLIERY